MRSASSYETDRLVVRRLDDPLARLELEPLRLARLFGVQLRRALVASEADRALVRARAGRYL